MKMPSASNIYIAMECPGSCHLPFVNEERGPSANKGTALHKAIDDYFSNGLESAQNVAAKDGVLIEFDNIDKTLFAGIGCVMTEASFEYDPLTKVGYNLGKGGFSGKLDRIRGIADLVGLDITGQPVVIDWKTGYGDYPKAIENWQLIVAALVYRPVDKSKGVTVRLVKTATGNVDSSYLSPEYLDGCAQRLESLSKALNSDASKTRFKTGQHCRYCKSWTFCPAQLTAVKRVLNLEESLPVDSNRVAEAISRLNDMKDLSVRAEGQIRNYIDQAGGYTVMPDGSVYVPAAYPGKIKKRRS